jgi:DNA-binding GntR family transcriptional regulator
MLTNPRPTDTGAAVAHDRVYRALRTRIMHGEVGPGEAMTLRGLGREFGVSMTPAREAVRRLVSEGALFLSASGRVSTPELSNERIEELAAIRALLEPELSARALPRAHPALIERMEAINATIAQVIARRDAVGYIRATWSSTARSTCAPRRPRCWRWPKPSGCNSAPRCARSTGGSTAPNRRSITA